MWAGTSEDAVQEPGIGGSCGLALVEYLKNAIPSHLFIKKVIMLKHLNIQIYMSLFHLCTFNELNH